MTVEGGRVADAWRTQPPKNRAPVPKTTTGDNTGAEIVLVPQGSSLRCLDGTHNMHTHMHIPFHIHTTVNSSYCRVL